jgi:autotransporter translocation and assembly factor TamB
MLLQRSIRWARRIPVSLRIAGVALLLLVLFHHAILQYAVTETVGRVTGTHISAESSTIGVNSASFYGVSVTSASNEPLATIERLDVRYDLSAMGDARRIAGISVLHAVRPHIDLLRRADGTYNVPFQPSSQKTPGAFSLILRGTVQDGSIAFADESAMGRNPIVFDSVNADFVIDTTARTRYTASLVYRDGAKRYPISGSGSADAEGHSMLQHWSVARVPIARIATFVANDPGLRMQAGTLDGVDALYAGLPAQNGTMDAHFAATAQLNGGAIAVRGIAQPVRDIAGRLDVSGTAVTTSNVVARAGSTAVRFCGGVFDLAHPTLRVAASGFANLAGIHALVSNAALAPLRGSASFSALAIGPGTNPTVLASVRMQAAAYDTVPIDRADALAAVDPRGLDVLSFDARSGAAKMFSAGRAPFSNGTGTAGVALHAEVPSSAFAPSATLLPGMTLAADLFADTSNPAHPIVNGTLSGRTPSQTLSGAIESDAAGTGTFGPLRIAGRGGNAYARGTFDLPHRTFSALASVRGVYGADGAVLAHGEGPRIDVTGRGLIGGGRVVANGTFGSPGGVGIAASGVDFGTIHASGIALKSGTLSLGATIAGTLSSPRATGAFAMSEGGFDNRPVDAGAAFAVHGETLRVSDALASFGTAIVDLEGRVRPFGAVPEYDVAARVRGGDIHDLALLAAPGVAPIIDGTVDADLRLAGSGVAPRVSGTFVAPEGSFNGQAFRSLSGTLGGDANDIAVNDGAVTIGSTRATFDGGLGPGVERIALHARAVNLSDFNDFFDRGDVLAGSGRFDVRAAAAGDRVTSTSGSAFFSGARVLQYPLGETAARWNSTGGTLAMNLAFGGASGQATAVGTIRLSDYTMNVSGRARNVDLAAWMPLAGASVPVTVTGHANADVTARGRYPDLSLVARGDVHDATAGGVPIQQLAFAGHASGGRGTIDSAHLSIPYLDASASGTFGLAAASPMHLSVHAVSPDAAKLATTITGRTYDAAGAVDSTLSLSGTPAHPIANEFVTVDAARYGAFDVPHAIARLVVDEHHAELQQGELDLTKGRLTANAVLPVARRGGAYALGRGPISARVGFEDVELSNFAALLPPKSMLSGRIDGFAGLSGTTGAPQLTGNVALAGGAFSSPQEEVPITALNATLAARGSTIQLVDMNGKAGSGTFEVTGSATAPSLLESRDLTLAVNGWASGVKVDLPAYFKGQVDGAVAFTRSPGSLPLLKGDVSVSHARLPISAFLQASGAPSTSKPPDVALNLGVHAGTDVRVQSPNVDVGGTGSLQIAGTLDAPSIGGHIDATGGSVSFYRDFRIQRGRVTFDPSDGLIPSVNAVATTYIGDPDTTITINVTGPVTQMQLGLSSEPSYDRTQILGLLAGAQNLGAIPGVAATSGTGFSASAQAENLAFGQVNQAFTRGLLDPLSANLGSALGLANLDLYNDVGEGFGFSAKQKIGKHLTATGSESFGANRRQDIEIGYHPSDVTALQLHLYQQQAFLFNGAQSQASVGNIVFNVTSYTIPPIDGGGTSGISLSLQRKYW